MHHLHPGPEWINLRQAGSAEAFVGLLSIHEIDDNEALELGGGLCSGLRFPDHRVKQTVPIGLAAFKRYVAEFDCQHFGVRQIGRRSRVELADTGVAGLRGGTGTPSLLS